MDPATDGPAIRAGSGSARRRTPSTSSSTCGTTCSSTAATSGIAKDVVNERVDELLEFVQLTEKAKPQGRGPVRRHEAPAHHRPQPDQPARPAAARRADHRARPAGPARAVGPAVPAQAVGRDAGDHDALHGRGRAALRPAGRHGQGADRRRGLAARPDRASTPPARSPSCGSASPRTARATTRSPRRSPTSATGSRCCPTGCSSTARTARRSSPRSTSAASSRSRCWSAAPRSRTCSCGSPAGRWWTDGWPPVPGSRSVQRDGVSRQVDYWATLYQRTWRSSVISSFIAPLFYVLGDGGAARRVHRGRPGDARGRDVVPPVRGPRPDRRARDADRGRRDDVPGHGHDQVAAHLRLDARDAARGAATSSTRTSASWRSGSRRRAASTRW